jgi:hypothetical protein
MRRPTLALCVLLGVAAPAAARAEPMPVRQQALVLLRVLAYDHNLKTRARDAVTVIVVFDPRGEGSRAERDALVDGLDAVQRLRVLGMPVKVEAHELGPPNHLPELVARLRPSAVFLCQGQDAAVAAVSQLTRAARVLSFAASEAYVRAGLSVGIVGGAERPRILVNLAAARGEGAAFDAGLLKLAEVLR